MASHSLKLFTIFICTVAFVNLSYYTAYWKLATKTPAMRIMRAKRHFSKSSKVVNYSYSDEPKIDVSLLKVMYIPAKNKKMRYKKTMMVKWSPQFLCEDNGTTCTNTNKSVGTTNHVDYRDPENISESTTELKHTPLCSKLPLQSGLIDFSVLKNQTKLNEMLSVLELGGSYKPSDCVPTESVAIIVPYRGQEELLTSFVNRMHCFLLKQLVEYQIFVIKENSETPPIHIGRLFNIGFLEAQKIMTNISFTCVVFHDPDLVPADFDISYRCSEQPRQLVGYIDGFPATLDMGMVFVMRPEDFYRVNGFSNLYFDIESVYLNMYDRLHIVNNIAISVLPEDQSGIYNRLSVGSYTRYLSITDLFRDLIIATISWEEDGLNHLSYIKSVPDLKSTYTLIEVDSKQMEDKQLTISTKSSNPLYDETTTASTTTKAFVSQSPLQLRTRILGRL